MESWNVKEIIAIGLNEEQISGIREFISDKYTIKVYGDDFDIDGIMDRDDVYLFLVNTDKPWTGIIESVKKLKKNFKFQNVPVVGLALKKHIDKMDEQTKLLFEDIILTPCSYEDLLNRIEIWVKTYEIISNRDIKACAFINRSQSGTILNLDALFQLD